MTSTPLLSPYSDRHGKRLLRIRLTTGNTVAYYNTHYKIAKSNWTGKKVINTHDALEINKAIEMLCLNARTLWLEHRYDARSLCAVLTKDAAPDTSPDFFTFSLEYIKALNPGYRDQTRASLNKLLTFNKLQPLPFSSITPMLLRQYESYLRELGNETATIAKALGTIRTLCNKAVHMQVIPATPFNYKLPSYKHKNVLPLSPQEIHSFSEFDIEDPSIHPTARHAYYIQMFGFLTGLRISDRLFLRWDQVITEGKEKIISMRAKKTDEPIIIRVTPPMQEILDKYKSSGKYIFPFVKKDATPEIVDRELSRCTATVNKWLRWLSPRCGITKRHSTHVARHSVTSELMRITGSSAITAQALSISEKTLRANYYKRFPNAVVHDAMTQLYK